MTVNSAAYEKSVGNVFKTYYWLVRYCRWLDNNRQYHLNINFLNENALKCILCFPTSKMVFFDKTNVY